MDEALMWVVQHSGACYKHDNVGIRFDYFYQTHNPWRSA